MCVWLQVSSAFVQLKDSYWVDINADQPVESVHAQVPNRQDRA